MKFRELVEAVQWFPGVEHASVCTTVIQSGMAADLHEAIAHEVRAAKGQLGVIWVYDAHDRPGWALVHPGDWIVTRGRRNEVVTDAEFRQSFEPYPNGTRRSENSLDAEGSRQTDESGDGGVFAK